MSDHDDYLQGTLRDIPNLRSGLADTLLDKVRVGELKPGEKLPTEQEIMEATGVSRTVVREALAQLRALGVVTTRQGLGTFVAANPISNPFSIVPNDVATVDDLLAVLELRIGIEAEAAALAAERRTAEDLAGLRSELVALDKALAQRRDGTQEDLAFHRALMVASHSPYYVKLFDTFGQVLMPRQWAYIDQMPNAERRRHIARQKREHEAIFSAVEAGNALAARRTLRRHLANAIGRFMDLRNRLS